MAEEPRRQLLLALTASALVHVVVLLPAVRLLPLRLEFAARPIEAEIQRPASPTAVVEQPTPAPRHSVAQRPAAARPLAAPADKRRLAVARAEPTVREAQVEPAEQAPLPGPASDRPPVAGGQAPAGGPVPARDGVSADDLRQYRIALAVAARRFKRYPALARERGIEGRVEVAVDVRSWPHGPELSLARSSGSALLDRQAIWMIEQASASTTLPEGLRGRNFSVLLPVEFSLEDDR
ncbi:TonB family protein [Accumulibacter sp.]|uniref:TonB family protein n=1 Tax=Accumulibacter sp. TaxID=2053492 RepID=UPI0025E7DD25|nr:TonB family protein [Accumulibacter sp.]MCM8596627.1 TonB family protein [Accumulibacter sp.]MCM8627546.1 TonB family protein [Accumulibacter sp.]MDS4050775.1 TonB family protein [Accumulibacter sp.]